MVSTGWNHVGLFRECQYFAINNDRAFKVAFQRGTSIEILPLAFLIIFWKVRSNQFLFYGIPMRYELNATTK